MAEASKKKAAKKTPAKKSAAKRATPRKPAARKTSPPQVDRQRKPNDPNKRNVSDGQQARSVQRDEEVERSVAMVADPAERAQELEAAQRVHAERTGGGAVRQGELEEERRSHNVRTGNPYAPDGFKY